jgi:hypothetical protein
VQNRFQSGAQLTVTLAYEDYVQEAYHPNGLPEYDKAVDFQGTLLEIILTFPSNLFRSID